MSGKKKEKQLEVINMRELAIPAIRMISFKRFRDHRGYFSETYRKMDFMGSSQLDFFKEIEFLQCNESFSKTGVVRGLHFQWDPYMGKLVRTIFGRMIDMVVDIRKGSPHFGKMIMIDMPAGREEPFAQWLWVPPGFAHGNFFPEETIIEYFCSGEYNPNCEAGISPLAVDIDFSLCDMQLKNIFDKMVRSKPLMTDKDRKGFSINEWQLNEKSDKFLYGSL